MKDSKKRIRKRRFYRKVYLTTFLVVLMLVMIRVLVAHTFRQDDQSMDKAVFFENENLSNDKEKDMDISPLFVGDSRTVGLSEAVEGIDFHARNGSTYYYLTKLEDRIKESAADCIVIGFGVNDLGDIEDYIEFANKLGEEIEPKVFFLSVNPVDESKEAANGYNIKNSKIESFNKKLFEGAINYTYINTYSYLCDYGYNTVDGLHYTPETYQDIYEYTMSEIRRNFL